jgi:hypothetical protein
MTVRHDAGAQAKGSQPKVATKQESLAKILS